jgi:hypothetical protein
MPLASPVICMRCGYEVPGMILLQAYLYTYSLLTRVTFKVLYAAMHLAQQCCHCWKHFGVPAMEKLSVPFSLFVVVVVVVVVVVFNILKYSSL